MGVGGRTTVSYPRPSPQGATRGQGEEGRIPENRIFAGLRRTKQAGKLIQNKSFFVFDRNVCCLRFSNLTTGRIYEINYIW
jgi:hypothetical protein